MNTAGLHITGELVSHSQTITGFMSQMMNMNITAIDLDQAGPQERVRHMNLKMAIIITPWAVANVKACGAKKSIGMVMVV